MKIDQSNEQMRDIYAKIYQDLYNLDVREMENARYIIQKNLHELAISKQDLTYLNVLDTGTGRQTVVFCEMGAKRVFYRDISDIGVDKLNNNFLKIIKNKVDSKVVDLSKKNSLQIDEKIDLVYWSGILHHLYHPENAIQNLLQVLKKGSKVFLRIYKSGSFNFFVVDFIRKFISLDDQDLCIEIYDRFYNGVDTNQGLEIQGDLFVNMMDDFFVPILILFNTQELDRLFGQFGFNCTGEHEYIAYDHYSTNVSSQGTTLIYELSDEKKSSLHTIPLKHIDQMDDIEYQEQYIKQTILIMRDFLTKIDMIPTEIKIELAIKIYSESRMYCMKAKDNLSYLQHQKIQNLIKGCL